MKLKNILLKSAICSTAALLAVSCSDIDEDNRLVYVKPAQVNRTVLIEDFTGQRCINCPFATLEIEKLIEQYGEDHIIAVGIHSGLGMKDTPTSKYQGLMTDTGNEYYSYWGRPGQPAGLVNRTTSSTVAYTRWGDIVRTEIEKTAPLSLSVTNAYNESDRTVGIDIKANGTDGETKGKLQVWLVEDNIVSIQEMPTDLGGGRKYDYIHNHVFRANVTSELWGDAVTVKEGEATEKTYTYTIPEKWNADNVSVVAFVTSDSDGSVQQVTKKSIK